MQSVVSSQALILRALVVEFIILYHSATKRKIYFVANVAQSLEHHPHVLEGPLINLRHLENLIEVFFVKSVALTQDHIYLVLVEDYMILLDRHLLR